MEFQEQNNFEEEWRKAFEGASLPPSDELWGRIESELDKKKKRSPFLFFLRPSFIATGLAAALALVLGNVLFFNTETKNDVAQATAKPGQSKDAPGTSQSADDTKTIETPIAGQEVLASAEIYNKTSKNKETTIKTGSKPVFNNAGSIASTNARKTDNKIINLPSTDVDQSVSVVNNTHINSANPDSRLKEAITPLIPETVSDAKVNLAGIENLEGKKYRYFGSRYTLNRSKLAFDAEMLENTENTSLASNESKVWVGLQSGVAPFDPNMKFSSLNTLAYSSANEYAQLANGSPAGPGNKDVQVSRPQNDIKAGLAINSGVAVGYKIAKKWHIESGVRYLRGNSTLETNTYAFQNNGYVNTFLGDYLLQNSAKDYSLVGSNTVVADASKFGNRYEYLMVPMQVGYEIGISKKLGLNVLAGFSTDIFLQNSIFTDNGLVRGKNTISTDSKIYKPVNFSGLGGLRATYAISRHWQANIGTSYQRALFSGMNSSVDLNMRLQMFGLNYGFNYRF